MRRGTVTVLCLVQFVDVLVVTSATTAIPAILAGVGADASAAGPLATVYAMFFGGLLILGARLGDRYGHRRILLVGIAGFGAVSLLGAAAGLLGPAALAVVLVSRALQGAAAAISVPSALKLLLDAAPEGPARRRALAAWSATGAAAGASGFLVGGLLVQAAGWPAVFWFNVPLAAALFAGVASRVSRDQTSRDTRPLDIPGATLLILSVMAVIVGAALLESPGTRTAGVAGVAAGAGIAALLAWRLRTASHPLIPREAFASRPLRQGTGLSFANTATTSSSAVLAALYLQDELRIGPVGSGLTLMALSVAVVLTSATTGTVFARLAPHLLAALGLGTIAAGQFVLAATVGSWWGVLVGVAFMGAGLGLASVAATTIGATVPERLMGSASGILNTGAQVGTALGTAAIILVASLAGYLVAWLAAGVAAALTAGWCLLPRTRGTATPVSGPGSTGR
ncbi:MFS transporter [Leifsonia sp. F6_8S_P_1B]|uniref:MFS transporter n=1 Tax=Leifsonia williamsii TaxID=3035919 RepID=A0ABT8KF97_9MICO|nr:MFS transporter [Leifsonia williamsii]MDN4616129.1 MFS transporter [Leifsonia williamsii]